MWELNKNWIRVTREKNMNTFILDDAGNKLKKTYNNKLLSLSLTITYNKSNRTCSTWFDLRFLLYVCLRLIKVYLFIC